MISKNTYQVLKRIPQYPDTVALIDLQKDKKIKLNISQLAFILEDAMECNYITPKNRSANSDITNLKFFINECGQIELEEYKDRFASSSKSTWALVISGLSLLASIAAIIVSVCVQ